MRPIAYKTVNLGEILTSLCEPKQTGFGGPAAIVVVEEVYEEFFKQIGWEGKEWNVIPDDAELNSKTLADFKKEFLIYFYRYEIGYETSSYFADQLGSWFRRYMPRYIKLMQAQEKDLFMTSDITTFGTGASSSKTNQTHADNGKNRTKGAFSDTPQNELEIDLDNLEYASNVQTSETASVASGSAESQIDGTNENVTRTLGRGRDVFDIIAQWRESNYDQFLSIFDQIESEGYFSQIYSGSFDPYNGGDFRGYSDSHIMK